MATNTINWFVNAAFDAPELNSPQPCTHGSGCAFKRQNAEGIWEEACCAFVHPGEEGNGRRLFPGRLDRCEEEEEECPPEMRGSRATRRKTVWRSYQQPECVRLTGGATFYERRRLRLSWAQWCALKGIPYVANQTGVPHTPIIIAPIQAKPVEPSEEPLAEPPPAEPPRPLTKNERQRRNRRAKALAEAQAVRDAAAEMAASLLVWDPHYPMDRL